MFFARFFPSIFIKRTKMQTNKHVINANCVTQRVNECSCYCCCCCCHQCCSCCWRYSLCSWLCSARFNNISSWTGHKYVVLLAPLPRPIYHQHLLLYPHIDFTLPYWPRYPTLSSSSMLGDGRNMTLHASYYIQTDGQRSLKLTICAYDSIK